MAWLPFQITSSRENDFVSGRQWGQDSFEQVPQKACWDLETGCVREAEELCLWVAGVVWSGAPLG